MTFFHVSANLTTQYSVSESVGAKWINSQDEQELFVDTLKELHELLGVPVRNKKNENGVQLWDSGLTQSVYRSFSKYEEMTIAEYLSRKGEILDSQFYFLGKDEISRGVELTTSDYLNSIGVPVNRSLVMRITNGCKKKCNEVGLFYKIPESKKNTYPVCLITLTLGEIVSKLKNNR